MIAFAFFYRKNPGSLLIIKPDLAAIRILIALCPGSQFPFVVSVNAKDRA